MKLYSLRKEEVRGALGSGYILKEYVIAPDGHEERYSAERSVRELNYLARKLTAATALLRECRTGIAPSGVIAAIVAFLAEAVL